MLTVMILRCRRDDDDGLQSETKKRGINAMVKIFEATLKLRYFVSGRARFDTDSDVTYCISWIFPSPLARLVKHLNATTYTGYHEA
jgi:hypothetical protein